MLVENARPTETKKKFVIKGLKSRPKLPDGFEGGTWDKLKNAVTAVQNAQAVGTSFEELYQAVESMCIHKRASALYEKLCAVCDAHTGARVRTMAEHLGKDDPEFLQHMDKCWREHCDQMMMIRAVFLYLDRSYVALESQLQARSIFDMGLQQFRTHLEGQKQVLEKVVQGTLLLIKAHRAREAVDSALLLSLVRMLRDLGLYAAHFQGPFLAASESAYAAEGLALAANSSVSDALEEAERRLEEETPLCKEFLDPSTLEPALAVVKKQLLERHFESYLTRGLGDLLQESRLPALARFLRLARLIGRQDMLRQQFQAWLLDVGTTLVKDTEKEASLIESLLQLRAKMNTILAEPFCRENSFAKAIRDAFEKFMNARENKPGELLAKYLDSTLRSGTRKCSSEAELDAHLDSALALFRYLQAKDVFEAFYKKDFAKRLLMDKSSSIDVEKSMIAKLKAECGAQYTSKLEGMFKDEQVSKDIDVQFKGSEQFKQLPPGMDAHIRVLTSGFWPTYPVMDITLPTDIRRGRDLFGDYYLKKHNGRKLTWHSTMETCTLKTTFAPGNTKELLVSVHQACVLLLFNKDDCLPFSEIHSRTDMPLPELKRALQSLACGKTRVLKKDPLGKEVGDKDTFTFLKTFTHPLYKIKINQIQIKETVEENKRTNDQVLQDRQYQIDAAIVRTMKARKQLSHKLLVNEVMTQLKFTIRATDLKKRIENLIEREYLARTADSMDVYNYLA